MISMRSGKPTLVILESEETSHRITPIPSLFFIKKVKVKHVMRYSISSFEFNKRFDMLADFFMTYVIELFKIS